MFSIVNEIRRLQEMYNDLNRRYRIAVTTIYALLEKYGDNMEANILMMNEDDNICLHIGYKDDPEDSNRTIIKGFVEKSDDNQTITEVKDEK